MKREKAGIVSLKPAPIPPPSGTQKALSPMDSGMPPMTNSRISYAGPDRIFRVRKDGTFIAVNQFLTTCSDMPRGASSKPGISNAMSTLTPRSAGRYSFK